jgi:hypothetical protein
MFVEGIFLLMHAYRFSFGYAYRYYFRVAADRSSRALG